MAIIGFIVILIIGVLALGVGLLSLSFCTKIGAGPSDLFAALAIIGIGVAFLACAFLNSPFTITLVTP